MKGQKTPQEIMATLPICQLQMVYLPVYGNLCMMYIANSTKKNLKELSKMGGSKAGGGNSSKSLVTYDEGT